MEIIRQSAITVPVYYLELVFRPEYRQENSNSPQSDQVKKTEIRAQLEFCSAECQRKGNCTGIYTWDIYISFWPITDLCSIRGNDLRQRKEAPDISRSNNSQSLNLAGNGHHSHQPY